MQEIVGKLKKIVKENEDKRILILNVLHSEKLKLQRLLGVGEQYDKVFDNLLIEKFGFIETRYIPDAEQEKVEKSITITKGIPLFSNKIIDSDIMIFLYINPQTLRILCSKDNVSYEVALEMQKKIQKELKLLNQKIITINLYSNNLALEDVGRKVYICDSNNYYLCDKRDMDIEDESFLRFPYIIYVNELEDIKRKQGFLLIINEDYLNVTNHIDIDKKYRKLFNHFNLVYIITNDNQKINMFHINFSNIYFVDTEYFDDDVLMEIYYDYILKNNKIKFSKKKMLILDKMNKYFKNKYSVNTKELKEYLNISYRNVERYMNDYNKIYKNIGYDYVNNEWYIIH